MDGTPRFETPQEKPNQNEAFLRATNMLQMELASNAEEEFSAWTEKYASLFRKMIEENPELVAQWENEATHDVVLREIQLNLSETTH